MIVEFVEGGPRLHVNRVLDTWVKVPETGLNLQVMRYEITVRVEDGEVVVEVPGVTEEEGTPFSRRFTQNGGQGEPRVADLRELALYLNSPALYYGL